jgi:ribonuclease HI
MGEEMALCKSDEVDEMWRESRGSKSEVVGWWVHNGWETSTGAPVKNRDLWEELLDRLGWLEYQDGIRVEFWNIRRWFNYVANRLAKQAACAPSIRYWDSEF